MTRIRSRPPLAPARCDERGAPRRRAQVTVVAIICFRPLFMAAGTWVFDGGTCGRRLGLGARRSLMVGRRCRDRDGYWGVLIVLTFRIAMESSPETASNELSDAAERGIRATA